VAASAGRRGPPWLDGWTGELLRILLFGALLLLLGLGLGVAWALLPLPTDGAWVFAGTTVTAAAAVLAGVLLLRWADGRDAAALGLGMSRRTLQHVGLGMGIGAAGLVVAVLGIAAAGALSYESQPGTWGAWLATVAAQGAVFTVAALAEEAIFRGYPFQVLVRWTGPVAATLLSAVLFAVAHGANPEVGVLALVNIFLAGVLLAVAYLRTLSLWFATALHLAWNWTMATLFDLPVSGIALFDTPLYDAAVGGPEWWTGGGFGPEGGLVGTLGFGVALLLVLRLRAVRPDERIAAAGPLVLDRVRGAAATDGRTGT
jgi:uncharacterized protein